MQLRNIFLLIVIPLFLSAGTPYVLVTGGSGYIGSQTCKALKQAGFIPIVYDLEAKNPWGPAIQGNVLDTPHLKEVLTEFQPLCVIHFAALISVPASVEDPYNYYLTNFMGSLSLLEAMKECKVKNIIFSSTASLYGNGTSEPLKEEASIKGLANPYARSKWFTEECIKEWSHSFSLNYVIFRYFNAAGADLEGEMGQLPEKSHHLITNCLKATLTDKEMTLFGRDFPTPDGTTIRDYIHVADLADAHVRAVSYLLKGGKSELINLGTGKGLSVKEVLDSVQKITGIPLTITAKERRQGDVDILIADNSKAYDLLGWRPLYSDIDTIIRSAWRFTEKYSKEKAPSKEEALNLDSKKSS